MSRAGAPDAAYTPENDAAMHDADNDPAYVTSGRGKADRAGPQVVDDRKADGEGLGNVPSSVMDSDKQLGTYPSSSSSPRCI